MYGEIPYPDIEVKDIQASVRNGARLFQPEKYDVKPRMRRTTQLSMCLAVL